MLDESHRRSLHVKYAPIQAATVTRSGVRAGCRGRPEAPETAVSTEIRSW